MPGVRLWAKLEGQNPTGSLKDRIALRMIEEAERDGRLEPGATILEPTSGNTGIALAMVASRKGYKLVVVIPENASEERIQLLEMFGAEVVFTDADKGTNGSIEVARRMEQTHRYFMPFQYGNPANPAAHYDGTGAEIVRDLPEVTHFVAGLGTGGTLTGAGRRLKEHNPDVKVIAAEPELGELVYGLRSLDAGFIPPILDETVLDGKFLVNSSDALHATRDLLEKEGILAGPVGRRGDPRRPPGRRAARHRRRRLPAGRRRLEVPVHARLEQGSGPGGEERGADAVVVIARG